MNPAPDWRIFRGDGKPHGDDVSLPEPPPWRPFRSPPPAPPDERPWVGAAELPESVRHRGSTFQATPKIVELVNAAIVLRRPLLVTGQPGSGKSSLVDAIAYELELGEPLVWSVTSRSTLRDALYSYDAVGRLQASRQSEQDERAARRRVRLQRRQRDAAITEFLRLGPLGTALLPTRRPRALLIDEIDKADLDLPNDLLNVLEEGQFDIPELARLDQAVVRVRVQGGGAQETYPVHRGRVQAHQFPVVVFTSNGERDFPAAFRRRCLSLDMPDPCADVTRLTDIVRAHLGTYFDAPRLAAIEKLIADFHARAQKERLATDQLLNAVLLVVGRAGMSDADRESLVLGVTRKL